MTFRKHKSEHKTKHKHDIRFCLTENQTQNTNIKQNMVKTLQNPKHKH